MRSTVWLKGKKDDSDGDETPVFTPQGEKSEETGSGNQKGDAGNMTQELAQTLPEGIQNRLPPGSPSPGPGPLPESDPKPDAFRLRERKTAIAMIEANCPVKFHNCTLAFKCWDCAVREEYENMTVDQQVTYLTDPKKAFETRPVEDILRSEMAEREKELQAEYDKRLAGEVARFQAVMDKRIAELEGRLVSVSTGSSQQQRPVGFSDLRMTFNEWQTFEQRFGNRDRIEELETRIRELRGELVARPHKEVVDPITKAFRDRAEAKMKDDLLRALEGNAEANKGKEKTIPERLFDLVESGEATKMLAAIQSMQSPFEMPAEDTVATVRPARPTHPAHRPQARRTEVKATAVDVTPRQAARPAPSPPPAPAPNPAPAEDEEVDLRSALAERYASLPPEMLDAAAAGAATFPPDHQEAVAHDLLVAASKLKLINPAIRSVVENTEHPLFRRILTVEDVADLAMTEKNLPLTRVFLKYGIANLIEMLGPFAHTTLGSEIAFINQRDVQDVYAEVQNAIAARLAERNGQ